MPGEGGPKNGTAAALLILWMTAAYNQLAVNLEGPTQQWMSRHYPMYRSLEVFQEPQEPRRCSEELLGELWLDVANSTTARSRCPSVESTKSLSTCNTTYATFAKTRALRLRTNLLHSLHTSLQYAHLPRQGPIGLDRSLRCPDRANSQDMRDRRHRDSYGPLACLRSHGHHRAHESSTPRIAWYDRNQSNEFSSPLAFGAIWSVMNVLTEYAVKPTKVYIPPLQLPSLHQPRVLIMLITLTRNTTRTRGFHKTKKNPWGSFWLRIDSIFKHAKSRKKPPPFLLGTESKTLLVTGHTLPR